MTRIRKIGIPSGGTTGQVLKKSSDANFDVEWGTGGGGSPTSLSIGTVTSTTFAITSDGSLDDVTFVGATESEAGIMTADDKIKINRSLTQQQIEGLI